MLVVSCLAGYDRLVSSLLGWYAEGVLKGIVVLELGNLEPFLFSQVASLSLIFFWIKNSLDRS